MIGIKMNAKLGPVEKIVLVDDGYLKELGMPTKRIIEAKILDAMDRVWAENNGVLPPIGAIGWSPVHMARDDILRKVSTEDIDKGKRAFYQVLGSIDLRLVQSKDGD